MNIKALVRPNIRTLQPYASARSLYKTGLFFDANENALGSVIESVDCTELNRYPDPKSSELRSKLAKFLGVDAKNVFAGNGSDEIIDLLVRLFVNPDERVIVMEPTYGVYKVAANTAGVIVKTCSLNKEFRMKNSTMKFSLRLLMINKPALGVRERINIGMAIKNISVWICNRV